MIPWIHRARTLRKVGAVLFEGIFYRGVICSFCLLVGSFLLFSLLRKLIDIGGSAYNILYKVGILGLGVSMLALGLERLLDAVVRCTCVRQGGRNRRAIPLAFCNLLPCIIGFLVGTLFIVIGV